MGMNTFVHAWAASTELGAGLWMTDHQSANTVHFQLEWDEMK
jgi:hypothetical protein